MDQPADMLVRGAEEPLPAREGGETSVSLRDRHVRIIKCGERLVERRVKPRREREPRHAPRVE